MESTAIEAVSLGGQAAVGMSVWHLFVRSDIIVKLVMIILLAASLWSWAIIFEKIRRIRRVEADANEFEDAFWAGGSLDQLYERIGGRPSDPMESLFASAMREWRRTTEKGLVTSEAARESLQSRIERVMTTTMARETDRLERHMIFLASVGSTAPFVGLFGTVWGIMNSFQAIAVSKNTSLAVVAPGIAEALFATALGLVAAIPAVLAYNKFSSDLGRYEGRMEGFISDFTAILSRQLQEKA
jgi:biopolymer transport protein TolQ